MVLKSLGAKVNWGVALGVLLWLSTSCAFKTPPTVLKLAPLPEDGNICRVAVLPFANQTEYNQADDIFGRVFVTELINSGNYQVAQEGDVRKFFQQMQVLPGQLPHVEQMRGLADRLGVQIIVAGAVVEMQDKTMYGRRLDPTLAVIIRIIEGSSGRTLWTTYNRREGRQYRKIMHFGLVNTATELAKRVSAEIAEAWLEEGLRKCSDL